jgi:predicted dehydrogenase
MKRIAIIGCGYIGKTHAAAIKNSGRLELAGVSDVNEESGKKLAGESGCAYYKDPEAMAAEGRVDIVDVCLPTALHEQYVTLAARQKKHVICEKPFALSSEAALRMILACEEAGVRFMIAQVVRWMPEYVKIRETLDKGVLGGIHMVYCSRLAQHPNWAEWQRDVKVSGGGLFDLHLHDIDYLYSLFGEADTVDAVGWKNSSGCWNHVISTLRFKNGVKAAAEGSMEMVGAFPFSAAFRVTGDKATLDYRLEAGFNIENLGAAASSLTLFEKDAPPARIEVAGIDPFQAELEAFASALEEGRPPPILPRDSLYVIKIIEALGVSLETGKIAEVG